MLLQRNKCIFYYSCNTLTCIVLKLLICKCVLKTNLYIYSVKIFRYLAYMIKFIPETRGMLGYLRVFWGFYFVIVLIVWYIVYLFPKMIVIYYISIVSYFEQQHFVIIIHCYPLKSNPLTRRVSILFLPL